MTYFDPDLTAALQDMVGELADMALSGLSGTKKTPKRPPNMLTPAHVYAMALDIARTRIAFQGVDPVKLARMTTAIAKKESTFNANAQNPSSTARGLMQILSGTQTAIEKMLKFQPAPDRIWDPAYSLLLGANYLAYQWTRYRDWDKAVWAYNQGSYPGKKKDGSAYRAAVLSKYQTIPFDSLT